MGAPRAIRRLATTLPNRGTQAEMPKPPAPWQSIPEPQTAARDLALHKTFLSTDGDME